MKILTVAIPCYNSENYMDKCIRSLLPAGEDIEILIVDDGSTKDRTAQIADEYEAQYPGIVRAIHQENGGVSNARNAGILSADGEYLHLCDSDDWLEPDAVASMLELALREQVELVVGGRWDVSAKTGKKKQNMDKIKECEEFLHIRPLLGRLLEERGEA